MTESNFDERLHELEDIRCECEQSRTLSRDIYATETYKIVSEEHSITIKMPDIEQRLENYDLIPLFGYDLIKHCSKRKGTLVAYPIEICIRLLENSLNEEETLLINLQKIEFDKVKQLELNDIRNVFDEKLREKFIIIKIEKKEYFIEILVEIERERQEQQSIIQVLYKQSS
ncbi:unnamed protein product [Rotaria sordida]|uniref:Uncharacterized protein n=1 Tax=Rotaria sordida TaxID=392033 RepID=A0A815YWS8_9BILA|nr:unnamed protein product [Rotaria sordida]CAF1574905.1 unnamed protein product [Rotaria sordida]